jgi:filamentous hemagglutinin family protein
MVVKNSLLKFAVLLGSSINLSAHAQIILDGTLGHPGEITATPHSGGKFNFAIEAGLGQQHGPNLFHSFSQFDLNSEQIATFSGPDSIKNVISRITSGKPSTIDGTISSTIPEADFYFLNPSGLLLSKHARLNITGSFFTSTADTLYLGETDQFNATHPEKSVLSSAPPQAFGFLTHTPQPIHIQGSTLLLQQANKSLAFIGGSLDLDGTDSPNNVELFAMGQINLISLASQGEVTLTPASIDVTPETPGGVITINKLDISRPNVGNILIHGGHLTFKNNLVFKTRNQGEQGTITLRADEIEINNAFISNNTYGVGESGKIEIKANNLTLSEGSIIDGSAVVGVGKGSALVFNIKDTLTIAGSRIVSYSAPMSVGQSANIEITAHRVIFKNKAEMSNLNASLGESGYIRIVADELVMTASEIFGNTFSPLKQPDKMAAVEIIADKITLENGARISNGTFGLKKGGDIILKATEKLMISGGTVFGGSASLEPDAGKASTIYLQAPQITLTKQSIVNSSALASDAGEVNIQSNQLVIEKGSTIQTLTLGTGKGGSVNITTDTLIISGNQADITGIASLSTEEISNAGDAGEIKIKANIIKMKDKAFISTIAQNASGGDITIETPTLIHLQQGNILTNVKGGEGNGGNITIKAPTFIILDGAQIISQAKRGFGGDITIKADHFILAEQI